MRYVVIAFLLSHLIAPLSARADLVNRSPEGAELRLMDSQCSHAETLVQIRPEWREKFRNARYSEGGTIRVYGCWIQEAGGIAVLIMEDGSSGMVDLSKFSDPAI